MGKLYEGTWEEIAKHADELRGKHLRVTVVEDDEASWDRPQTPEEEARMQAAADRFHAEMDRLIANPPSRPIRTAPDPYGDALAEKFRKQGLDV